VKTLCMLCGFLLLSQVIHGEEATLQFEQGNQFYRSGEYQKAIQMYEQLLQNGYESPALYYNLGNVYFKIQRFPNAILQYERAKRLSPDDEDVLHNLRLCNLRVIDKIEPVPQLFFIGWWKAFIDLFSSDGWAVMAIISLWFTSVAGTVFIVGRTMVLRRIAFLISAIGIAACVLGFLGTYERSHIEQNTKSAIVFAASVPVKSAPDAQSTDLFVLHEGVKVEFLDAVGEWRKIRLADGKVGWLTNESIEVI
jgi:tetratricopeptide (TPR) repeat protein